MIMDNTLNLATNIHSFLYFSLFDFLAINTFDILSFAIGSVPMQANPIFVGREKHKCASGMVR